MSLGFSKQDFSKFFFLQGKRNMSLDERSEVEELCWKTLACQHC